MSYLQKLLNKAARLIGSFVPAMIVAWRVIYLTMMGRQCPDLPCDLVLKRKNGRQSIW